MISPQPGPIRFDVQRDRSVWARHGQPVIEAYCPVGGVDHAIVQMRIQHYRENIVITESSNAASLQLRVLGGLQISIGEHPLDDALSQKAKALLCYLALERREHARTALAALLWGEYPETDAAASLRQTLTQIRRVLAPFVVIHRHNVGLNPERVTWVDYDEIRQARASQGDHPTVDSLEVALHNVRGEFLQGFTLPDAPAFEEWAIAQRERIHDEVTGALLSLAEHYRFNGGYARSIATTLRLLALDRWREEAHRLLMWLYIRTGQRSAALAQYQACCQTLEHDLGVEPSAETTRLFERVKAAQTMPRPPILLPTTPFVGRAAELQELARSLAQPEPRLLTLIGPGGIGKTRLALQTASEWSQRFLHGTRFVSLAAVTTREAMLATLVAALGCPSSGSDDTQLQLRAFLADKDLLLVLDNVEQIIDVINPVIRDILAHAPDVRLLVTSRVRLQLRDERLLELAGLDVPYQSSADAERSSAVELFVQSARKLRAGFTVSEADMPAVVQICHLVEGTPLGIELAAAWTRVLSCADIAREIAHNLEFLTTSLHDLPPRHRNMRAVFDHSWRLLGAEEQRVLRRLSVFRGGFSREAAEKVAQASVVLLGTLLDHSMLSQRPGLATTTRYDMHELVRHYARTKLEEAGERTALRNRFLQFFLEQAETAQSQLVGPDQKEWLDLLADEHDNLREALQVAIEDGKGSEGVRLAGALWRFWWIRGHFGEGSRWLQRVLALETDRPGENQQGEQATPPFDSQTPTDRSRRAQALHGLGILLQEQGNFVEAQDAHEQSLALRRALGDRRGVAFSLNSLGVVAADQEQYARAQALYEESLNLKREFGDARGISGTLNNLGIVVAAQGEYTRARALYAESLELCRMLNDPTGIAVSLGNLGLIALDQNDAATAASLFGESLTLFKELGDRDGIVECLEGFAGVAILCGRFDEAALLFGATTAIRDEMRAPRTIMEERRYERLVAHIHSELSDEQWLSAWKRGQQRSLDDLLDVARAIEYDTSTSPIGTKPTGEVDDGETVMPSPPPTTHG